MCATASCGVHQEWVPWLYHTVQGIELRVSRLCREHLYTQPSWHSSGDHCPGTAWTPGHCLPLDPGVVFRNIWVIAFVYWNHQKPERIFVELHASYTQNFLESSLQILKYKVKWQSYNLPPLSFPISTSSLPFSFVSWFLSILRDSAKQDSYQLRTIFPGLPDWIWPSYSS